MAETLYFLGAGASREAGVPTQKELWDQVVARWKKTGDKDIKALLDFAAYLHLGETIEACRVDLAQLLTLMDLALEQNTALGRYDTGDLRQLRNLIVDVLCDILADSVKREKGSALIGFCQALASGDTVISLNYDTAIDDLLAKYFGYVSYGFEFANQSYPMNVPKLLDEYLLLKPHGSLNWLYCNCCNGIYFNERNKIGGVFLPRPVCPADSHPLRRVIVSPTYRKQFLIPHLHTVWMKCFHYLKNAKTINFIGYSFPPGDIHVIYMIKRAILAGSKRPQINIISRDSQGKVLDRCERIFADFQYYNTSFSKFFPKREY